MTLDDQSAGEAGAVHERAGWSWNRHLTPRAVLVGLPLVALVLAMYWQDLNPLDLDGDGTPDGRWVATWENEDAWSFGFLIPLIALLLVHYRLTERNPQRIETSSWGLVLILLGGGIRVASHLMMFGYPAELTFVLVVAGVVLWVTGWEMFKALWVPVAYLALMIPWPARIYTEVANPLQRASAAFTERVLMLIGTTVSRQGNVLYVSGLPITVAEACSGLKLLLAFVALGVMMAFLYRRPLWERAAIIGSSVPIAIFCNFIRIFLMAVVGNALYFEAQALQAGHPGWSAWMPQILSWSTTAWVGLVAALAGLFMVAMHRGLAWFEPRRALKIGGAMLVGGVGVILLGARFQIGYTSPDQLMAVREIIMNPESAPHQAFGFAMLGLAFVLMWLLLRLLDWLVTLLFIEDETPGDAGASGPPAKATEPS